MPRLALVFIHIQRSLSLGVKAAGKWNW